MALKVASTRLTFAVKGKVLCDGLFLNAEPGRFTAVMGPSGAGKSVFLKLAAGYLRPSTGRVRVGPHDLHADYDRVRARLGYVPQAEIMIPELTVAQSLDYRLRLQCPLMSLDQRRRQVAAVCDRLGLAEQLDLLLQQQIGRPESTKGSHPSGGQRRRVNIAHELLSNPEVLFLDEPTSGLSATDADCVVRNLAAMAHAEGLNVIATLHQPSRDIYRRIDDLLLVGQGGRVAYYGRAARAVQYFEDFGKVRMPSDDNPAEFIVHFVKDAAHGECTHLEFERHLSRGDVDFLRRPATD